MITYVEDRKGHDRRYAIAPDKIKAEIGWEPETMFKDGIKKTIAWYLEHEDWMNNVTRVIIRNIMKICIRENNNSTNSSTVRRSDDTACLRFTKK